MAPLSTRCCNCEYPCSPGGYQPTDSDIPPDQDLWYERPDDKGFEVIRDFIGDGNMNAVGALFVGKYHYGGEGTTDWALPPVVDALRHLAAGNMIVVNFGTRHDGGNLAWYEARELHEWLEEMGSTIEYTSTNMGGSSLSLQVYPSIYQAGNNPLLEGVRTTYIRSATELTGGIPLIVTRFRSRDAAVAASEVLDGGRLIVVSSMDFFKKSDPLPNTEFQRASLQNFYTNIIEEGCVQVVPERCTALVSVTANMGSWSWPHGTGHTHEQSGVPLGEWYPGVGVGPIREVYTTSVKVQYKGPALSVISGEKEFENLRGVGEGVWRPTVEDIVLSGGADLPGCWWGWWDIWWDVYQHVHDPESWYNDYSGSSPAVGDLDMILLGSFKSKSISDHLIVEDGHVMPSIPEYAGWVSIVKRGIFSRLHIKGNEAKLDVSTGVTWAWHDLETGGEYPFDGNTNYVGEDFGRPRQFESNGQHREWLRPIYLSRSGRHWDERLNSIDTSSLCPSWVRDSTPCQPGCPYLRGMTLCTGYGTGISSTDKGGAMPYPSDEPGSGGSYTRRNSQPLPVRYSTDNFAIGASVVTLTREDYPEIWPFGTQLDNPVYADVVQRVRNYAASWGISSPETITLNLTWG